MASSSPALVQIQLRHDTFAAWSASNPVLLAGEVGCETDTGRQKVGDGVRSYSALPYTSPSPATAPAPPIGGAQTGTSSFYARSDHSHPIPSSLSIGSLVASGNVSVGGKLTVGGVAVGGPHGHEIADINGLSSELAGLSPVGHSHTVSQLSDFPSQGGNAGLYLTTNGGTLSWKSAASSSATAIVAGSGITIVEAEGEYKVSSSGVLGVNGLSGNVEIVGGANVIVEQEGSKVVVSATSGGSGGGAGVGSVNGISGEVTIGSDGSILVTSSNQAITLESAHKPSLVAGAPSSPLGDVGTSLRFARSDHSHPTPKANDLGVNGDVDWGGYRVVHRSDYDDVSQLPDASKAAGLFVTAAGVPHFAHKGSWVKLSSSTGGGVTLEEIDDRVAALLKEGDNISLKYDDVLGKLTISAFTGGDFPELPPPTDPGLPPGEVPPVTDPPPVTDLPPVAPGYEIIADIPSRVTVLGGSYELTFLITGLPNVTYQWQRADADTPTIFNAIGDGAKYAGTQSNRLTVYAIGPADHNARFRLVWIDSTEGVSGLSNTCTFITSPISFSVNPVESARGTVGSDGVGTLLDDVSAQAVGGSGSFNYQWQVSQIPGDGTTAFGRGAIWLNLPGQNSAALSSIPSDASAWLLPDQSNPSFEAKIVFVRCRASDAQEQSFTPTYIYSSECAVELYAPPATVIAHPTDQPLVNGAATFFGDFSGRASVIWQQQTADGVITAIEAGDSARITTVGIGGDNFRTALALTGLSTEAIGTRYRFVLGDEGPNESVSSDWGALTGQVISITLQPQSQVVIVGATITLEVGFIDRGQPVTISWETRSSPGAQVAQVPGAASAQLLLPNVQEGAEYRAVVTGSAGSSYSAWARITVVAPSPVSGDPAFTDKLENATIYEGGTYADECTSNLLSGVDAIDHWACAAVFYSDGRRELHPLANGTSGPPGWSDGPLKGFPANFFNKYAVSLRLDEDCEVQVLVATNAFINPEGGGDASPFGLSPPAGRLVNDILSYPLPDIGDLSFPFPPPGFVGSNKAKVSVQRQEPFYELMDRAPWLSPQSYHFIGAASAAGIAVAVPSRQSDISMLVSRDEGRTWGSALLPYSLSATSVVYWNGRFHLFHVDPSNTPTAISSADGVNWESTGWQFSKTHGSARGENSCGDYGPDAEYDPTQFVASVCQGVLYVCVRVNRVVSGHDAGGREVHVFRFTVDGGYTVQVIEGFPGPVSGYGSFLVMGESYSVDGGLSWTRYGRRPRIGSSFFDPFDDGHWGIRRVVPGSGAPYLVVTNQPDDLYWHRVASESSPTSGRRSTWLTNAVSLQVPRDFSFTTSFSSGRVVGQGWTPFLGPQIGNHIYALGWRDGGLGAQSPFFPSLRCEANPYPALIKINVTDPNAEVGPASMVNFVDAHVPRTPPPWSSQNASDIIRGGYRYGANLPIEYLNGTTSVNSGPIIFCKNRAVSLFRRSLQRDYCIPGSWLQPPQTLPPDNT